MHFHFFVMVVVVSLYQDWLPFLAAVGYVFVHHGIFGALDPGSVFNHPAAISHPWKWAAVHAFFITGISLASLVNWRLNEAHLAQRRRAEGSPAGGEPDRRAVGRGGPDAGRRPRARPCRAAGHRRGHRTDVGPVRGLLLQRLGPVGELLPALQPVGGTGRGLRRFPHAPGDRRVRSHVRRGGRRPASTTSRSTPATARTRPIGGCRRAISRCAATSPRPSCPGAPSSAGCSSGTPRRVASASRTNASPSGSPPTPPWPSRTPASTPPNGAPGSRRRRRASGSRSWPRPGDGSSPRPSTSTPC